MPKVQEREFTSHGRLVRIRWVKSRNQYWAMIEGRKRIFEGDDFAEAKNQAVAWCKLHPKASSDG